MVSFWNSCIFGGDFNQDNNIDINDVIILINLIIENQLGIDTDLNDDNNTDILDIISMCVLALIMQLP